MKLEDFAHAIRAHKWLIFWCVVVATVPTVVATSLLPPSYVGEARLVVREPATVTTLLGSSDSRPASDPQRYIGTQMEAMTSRTVVEEVIRTLGLDVSPADLLSRVTVSNDGQSDVVTIEVLDSSAARAAQTANAIAQTYVDWATGIQRANISAAADDVEARLALAQKQIISIEATISAGGSAAEWRPRLQAANDWYQRLASTLDQLQTNEQLVVGPGSILSTAAIDSSSVSPTPTRNGALAVIVGLVFGLGMAFLSEFLNHTIKSGEEASDLYGAPIIGQIAEDRSRENDPLPRQPVVLADPTSLATESYRGLRNSIEFINFERSIKTLLVTSAVPMEGKSTVAANLATALALTGWKVVLVVADFRRAGAEKSFGSERSPGLSEVLAGTCAVANVLSRPMEGLLVLASGETPPNPNELLGSGTMERLLKSLGESADFVIVDSPPLLAVADAATVARWMDAALVVTRAGFTTRDAAREAHEQFAGVGKRIIGVVVTGVKHTAAAHSGYNVYNGYAPRA